MLSKSAVSQVTEVLWQQYEAFASRDLGEFKVLYLFVDGIAERLHLGQPREAVLCAWATYAALIRASDSWRGVKVTEFETRQLQGLREELQRAHAERISPVVRVSAENRPTKVSSKNRT